jgi:hypothetical protein
MKKGTQQEIVPRQQYCWQCGGKLHIGAVVYLVTGSEHVRCLLCRAQNSGEVPPRVAV